MDMLMVFLHKYIGGFFTWWQKVVPLPTIKVADKGVNLSFVAFAILLWLAMWTFLPGGWLYG